MNTQILYDLGLTKNEVEVFLKLLELGPSTAVEISKASDLHRPNVYDALNKLIKRGLVAYFVKENTKYYETDDPERLITLLKHKELELRDLIPELKVKQVSAKPRSSVATFEGIVGARRMLNEILDEGTKDVYILGVPKEYAPTIGEGWLLEWHQNRIKKKIKLHHIVNPDYHPHRIKLLGEMEYTTLKFLPEEYGTPNATYIYDHGVVMIFVKPFLSIRILSEDLAKSFKRYYALLDKIALKDMKGAKKR